MPSWMTAAVLAAAGLVLCAAATAAQKVAEAAPRSASIELRRAALDPAGRLRVTFDHAAFEALRAAPGGGSPVAVDLPLTSTETAKLQLQQFHVTTPTTRFFRADRAGSAPSPVPTVVLLRGQIEGDANSHAFLALTSRGGGIGSLTRGDGRQFHLATAATQNQRHELVVMEGAGDVPDFAQFCVTLGSPPQATDGGTSPTTTARGPRVLNIAIDADQKYVNLFPAVEDAEAYIVQVLGAISDIYQRDLDFKLVLRLARVWPNGGEPFVATDLFGFRSHWINNENMAGLNLIHMFSGRRDTSYGGIAFLADGCSDFGFGIDSFLLGAFVSPAAGPHLWNWDVIVTAHEMGHNLGTLHTHDYDPPIDFCTSGVNERGTVMSYCHTNGGGLLNIDPRMHTRVADFIAANNQKVTCLWHDCNGNGVNDAVEISFGASEDVNANGIPDECEDCNQNGILDPADIAAGAPDVNSNGIPDSCEIDCNANNIPDSWEIRTGAAPDVNGNNVPDSCEPDCDDDGEADFLEILNGSETDYDRNSVPDSCQDCNSNGVADWLDVDRQFNIFIAHDNAASPVREYHAASGVFIRELGAGEISGAFDLTFGPDRQLYVASFDNHRVVRIDVESGIASSFVASGAGGLNGPSSVVFGPDGNLFVASQNSNSILKYNGATGAFMGAFVPSGGGGLSRPWDLAFGPGGNLFVIGNGNHVLQYHGATGAFINEFIPASSGALSAPRAMAFLPNGDLLITNNNTNRITRFSSGGVFLGKFNDEYALNSAWSIAIGPNGNVYAGRVSDVRVVEYRSATGKYLRSFVRGDSALTAPRSIVFRPGSPHDVNRNFIPDECEPPICLADISPSGGGGAGGGGGDGFVNTDDLLAVINAWGACPIGCLPYCAADITHDCQVNVNDLLAVINSWGPCR